MTVTVAARNSCCTFAFAGCTEEQPAAELQQQQSLAEAGRRRSSKEARRSAAAGEAGQQLRRASGSGAGVPEGPASSQPRPQLRRGSGSGGPADPASFQGRDSASGQHRPEGDLWRLATVPEGEGTSSPAASVLRPQDWEGKQEGPQHPHARFASAASDDGSVRPNWRFSDGGADASGFRLQRAPICLQNAWLPPRKSLWATVPSTASVEAASCSD